MLCGRWSPKARHRTPPPLTLLDSTCIIVGIIIGAGFYETTPQVARGAGGVAALLAAWLLRGVVSLVGALCYAELSAAYPRDGGEYVFLTRAFGRRAGFLFAWRILGRAAGNIGAIAYVFARYGAATAPAAARPPCVRGVRDRRGARPDRRQRHRAADGQMERKLLTGAKVVGAGGLCRGVTVRGSQQPRRGRRRSLLPLRLPTSR